MRERPIRVFVSATPDLEPEREVIGEALARFLVPVPWDIGRTARPGEQTPASLNEVRSSDLFLILLGADASAPVGAELLAAQRAGIPMLALVKEGPHTPAGRFFRYNSVDHWEQFSGPQTLRRLVSRWLAERTLDRAVEFGLTTEEIASLVEFVRQEPGAEAPAVTGKGEPQGAQEGAFIVSGRGVRREE